MNSHFDNQMIKLWKFPRPTQQIDSTDASKDILEEFDAKKVATEAMQSIADRSVINGQEAWARFDKLCIANSPNWRRGAHQIANVRYGNCQIAELA